ncbi:MAG: shikimate kinase [Oscillospiraceae bacterium]|nr:shikimate kinase [Oscillospiraceae bacterium]
MRSIILTGMMGCGKSTCGRCLSERLGRELVDTDAVIVRQAGKSISDIFAQEGEAAFRDLETAVCRELAGRDELVVAAGGGLVLRRENVELLKRRGVVVFLNRPAAEIFDSTSMAGRPLAQNGRAAFLETFAAREPVYRAAADVIVEEFATVSDTVRTLLAQLARMEGVL